MTVYHITIPGAPYAKKRPRFSRATGRAFNPKENASFESLVRSLALQQFSEPIQGPVTVAIGAFFIPPASWSRARTEAALGQPHTQRPDLDNIQKAVLDGLNRVAFADDSQVAEIWCWKLWGEEAKTLVLVYPPDEAPFGGGFESLGAEFEAIWDSNVANLYES